MTIVLRGWLGTGNTSNESLDVIFQHHKAMETLRESQVVVGCSICRALANELEKRKELDITEDMKIAIHAELSHMEDQDNLAFRKGAEDDTMYRLDFLMEMNKVETRLRTFALKPTGKPTSQLLGWTTQVPRASFMTIMRFFADH
jgi:thioredoxin-related protein